MSKISYFENCQFPQKCWTSQILQSKSREIQSCSQISIWREICEICSTLCTNNIEFLNNWPKSKGVSCFSDFSWIHAFLFKIAFVTFSTEKKQKSILLCRITSNVFYVSQLYKLYKYSKQTFTRRGASYFLKYCFDATKSAYLNNHLFKQVISK